MNPAQASANPTQRSFAFLKLLAEDLSAGEISFPTFIDATVKIRHALNENEIDLGSLARIISCEPLLTAKLVRTANSLAYNAAGKPISDVKSAVMRVGHATVKALAIAVAMEQLRSAEGLTSLRERTEKVWRHSTQVAAIAYVIAGKMTKQNPDEALFAGLVHDIGTFYLLSKACNHPDLIGDPAELDVILQSWHASIGHAVLQSLELPDTLLRAVNEHELERYSMPPRTLTDVLVLANIAARALETVRESEASLPNEPALVRLLVKYRLEIRSLVHALQN